MQKKYKILMIIIIVFLIIALGIGIFSIILKPKKEEIKNTTNVVSNIESFNYTLDNRDTKYMKEIFEELKVVLENNEIDYEKYATLIAKLYVIDFYTLNNKINKYDVGSLEYILNDKVEMFKTKAMDTIYSDIIDNTYKDRVQELPEITNVEIINVSETEIELNKENIFAYKVTMKYSYKKDLGYDSEGTIYLVKNDKKLEVAIYNPNIVIDDIEENKE